MHLYLFITLAWLSSSSELVIVTVEMFLKWDCFFITQTHCTHKHRCCYFDWWCLQQSQRVVSLLSSVTVIVEQLHSSVSTAVCLCVCVCRQGSINLANKPSFLFLLLSFISLSPSLSSPLQSSFLPQTHHLHFAVIFHKCPMSHSRRKWDDHTIRLNCKHLANTILQPEFDVVALGGFLSISIRKCFSSPSSSPFSWFITHFLVLSAAFSSHFCPPFCASFAPFLLPPLFWLLIHLAPLPALSLAWCQSFPLLLKNGKWR